MEYLGINKLNYDPRSRERLFVFAARQTFRSTTDDYYSDLSVFNNSIVENRKFWIRSHVDLLGEYPRIYTSHYPDLFGNGGVFKITVSTFTSEALEIIMKKWDVFSSPGFLIS